MNMIVCKFSFDFYVLLAALIVKNSQILAEIYFILLKKHPRPDLKDFQQQMCTSVKRLGK